ncbi:uncharacterized protein K460DRAFT_366541 [Cucurbitaria berberidis CBS 394.84]|uniref:Uncharacterized protein n=1 Tax=Cucurbitaria berberidis CBS 394.84 TaxID=1168544 RepID=A0A9P4GIE4_9PLEO|nr:uncharacterized protein K460DRAFT_366541 [Cucurbitaria berberidis CBS 394.84]KAF1845695.1 hypothetical protein K460DRAFT_366541 [Cucurbitaria berberidis CBS 394.84]
MDAAGIKPSMRDAIMDPQHNLIRLTQPLSGWLFEILDIYFRYLKTNQGSLTTLEPSEPSEPPKLQLRGGAGENSAPPVPAKHVALYRSTELSYVERCVAEDGTIRGFLDMQPHYRSDFAKRGGLYIGCDYWTAKYHAT